MRNAINDIYHCNIDVKAANKFIMITNKHLGALESEEICYRVIRRLECRAGIYHNIAVNFKEFDRVLTVIQNVNYLSARKSKRTFFI